MNERLIRERLHAERVPGEREARERSWEVVRAAFERREHLRTHPPRARLALALAAALLFLAIAALTPAGAAVAEWIGDVVRPGQERAEPALTSLPAAGRLLVVSEQGPWVVQPDGSKRLLGAYEDATWSPSGLFVAAARQRQLVAVDPSDATVRWSLAGPRPVRDPRWSPSGFRIAYLSGDSLHVVAGDGTGDGLLARDVARVAPAWRPAAPGALEVNPSGVGTHVLAFADGEGRVEVVDADSGHLLWRSAVPEALTGLEWSPDGRRLMAVADSSLRLLGRNGETLVELDQPRGASAELAAFSPDGDRIGLVRRVGAIRPNARGELVLVRLDGARPRERRLFSGPGRFTGLAWSPDGSWLLLAWRNADQWLFIRPAEVEKVLEKVTAVGDIARQFDPGGTGPARFPSVSGWCCPP